MREILRMRLSYILLLLVGFVTMAEAHPHVFADVKIKAVFGQNGFTGVQNQWSFDEVYSAAMVASADADGDGKIAGKETDEIKTLVLGPLQQSNYYNYVMAGTKFLPAGKIEGFSAAMKNGKLKKQSQLLEILKRLAKNKAAMVGLVIIVIMSLIAVFAPWIAPYSYEQADYYNIFQPFSKEHLLGTDQLGRDILSRLIYGSRYSLKIGIYSVMSAV